MPLFFLQSVPSLPPPAGPGVPVVALLFLMIPVLMIIIGTVLGFRALRDIRLAEGSLGGAMLATFAAGLVPAAVMLIVCGGGLLMLAEEISPVAGRKEDLWVTLGVIAGLWFSFLMMRRMHRYATGWQPTSTAQAPLTGTATAALILTILGGLLIFTYINRPDYVNVLGGWTPRELVLVNLGILTAGLICGVIARAERTGKYCAWICGGLFLFLVLAHA